jgi:ATP-dependent helicase IRC3
MIAYNLFDEHEDDTPRDATVAPIVLRPYQTKALAAIHAARDRGLSRVIVVMPTGTGKTTLFSQVVGDLGREGKTSLILAHRSELLTQAADRIRLQNKTLRVGIEGGDLRCLGREHVVVAGVQSIGRAETNRLEFFHPGLLIIDEAHHAPADSYQHVMRRVGSYEGKCFTVGVTATPHRMDNRPLHGAAKAIFEECCFTYTLREAIQDNYLCDLRGYRVASGLDLSGVKTVAGDYNQGQLERAVNVEQRNEAALKHWLEVARERRTIVFCVGCDHSREMTETFREHGVRAEHVDGAMRMDQREGIMKRFRSGETQVLCNVEIATEGFDVPEIACVLMLRPTQSWALYTQMIGRGLRILDGKGDCLVIDVVDNSDRHSIASVPGLLGLPAQMDLQGKSLKAAVEQFELLDDWQRGLLFKRPCTFESLSTKLTEVDLLGELSLPDEISGLSGMAWLKISDGHYTLSCGETSDGRSKRHADISIDTLGAAEISLAVGSSTIVDHYRGESPEEMGEIFGRAEQMVRNAWRDAGSVTNMFASWRSDKPTERQIELLRKFKIEDELIGRITKGQASQLITAKMAGRKTKR